MAQPEIIKDIDARIIRPTSTDNAIVRFNGTTGQVQNTANIIDDNNNTIINGSLYIPAKIIGYSNQNVYNLRLGPDVENHIDLGCDGIQAKIDSSNTASTLYLNFNGGEINIGGNLTPKADNALNLGSNGYRFKYIYSFYLHLQGSTNPWLKLDDGSSNTWYVQSVQSGNSMGFGNGWDKSLKIDNNGNVFFPGLLQNNFRLISNELVTSGTTAGLRNTLLIFGPGYGNDTAYIKTAGKLSLGDPGPQIIFNTRNSLTSGQRLALIYTDHNSIGAGNSLSLVSSESNAWFIAPTIKALTKFVGNLEGNATSATQDGNGKNIASTYRPLRRNICSQSEGTITNPWYKFASIIITGAYEDRTITFKVSQGYSDNAKMSGILTAHIRTTNPVGFENAQLIWEYANDSIVTSDWVLAYLSTSGTDCKVELWCKQDAAWSQYHFEVLSCHDRTGWRDDWVLYNTQSAGSASGPTSGYTQIKSVYGVLRASAVYGAVWNDYAEFRSSDPIEPGRVICETGNGTLKLSTERLQPGANVVSDTFGFAIGETENCKTPIAVSGRALVYTYEDRYSYSAGDPVCAAPGGTVSKMSREEVMMYPDRIVGTVSEIPEYKRWGTGNVEVKNRIWIKIK